MATLSRRPNAGPAALTGEYNAVPAEFRFDSTLNKLTWENKEEPLTNEEAMVISASKLAYAVEQVAAAIRALTDP